MMFALIIGIAIVSLFSALPAIPTILLMVFLGGFFYYKRFFIAASFLVGVFWALLLGSLALDDRLSLEHEGIDLQLVGTVASLPLNRHEKGRPSYQRFEVDVKSIAPFGNDSKPDTVDSSYATSFPETVRLSWYGGEQVQPGQLWRWKVRLKLPRGFSNPAGFDYEGWLFQRGIGATGYIKKSNFNRRLDPFSYRYSIPRIRQLISKKIDDLVGDKSHSGLILALINGDRSNFSRDQWQLLLSTGTNHLMVISGLHIGLIAVLAYRLIGFFYRFKLPVNLSKKRTSRNSRLLGRISDPVAIQCWAAISAALLYSAIAGFSLSTQRALIMVCVVMLSQVLGKNTRPLNSLLLALVCVLIFNPLAVITAGFWLSFVAVGSLLYVFVNRYSEQPSLLPRIWNQWGVAQWTVFIALFPVLTVLLLNVSLVSPFANLLAVPVVSFLIVPLCLAGALLMTMSDALAVPIFTFANQLFEYLWIYLEWLSSIGNLGWYPGGISGRSIAFALIGVTLVLAPRGFPARWLGIVCVLPLLLPAANGPDKSELEATVFDVGQGLAVGLRTANHFMLYDTGARFSADFDAGSAVVAPFMKQRGIASIDTLLLSHCDNDHAGGAAALLEHFPVVAAIIGSNNKQIAAVLDQLPAQTTYCTAGMSWNWDGVQFDLLYPFVSDGKSRGKKKRSQSENNRSCVLMVDTGSTRIMLTGDIDATVEKQLIKRYGEKLRSDILIAPHHGSRTSSSQAFIEQVSPSQVVISSGYNNRFHHPNAKVVERYNGIGAKLINTAEDGAIVYYLKANTVTDVEIGVDVSNPIDSGSTANVNLITPNTYRQKNRRYWHQN